jgi:cold-inducible RNA-binding protein
MQVELFIGNLPWSAGDTELEDVFQGVGAIQTAQVITGRDAGRSRGFGLSSFRRTMSLR